MSKSRKTSSRGFLFQKLIGIAILILAFIATLTPQKALAAYWWDSGSQYYILYSFNIPSYDKGPLWYLNQTKNPADSTTSGCTQSPASTAWLSDNTEFTADQTVSVKSTDTSVNLKFNYAGITCRTESSNSVSQNKAWVTSAPNTTNLEGKSVQTDFGVNSQPPNLVVGSTVFTYTPNGGFGGSACSGTATLKTCQVNVSYAAVDHFQYNNGGGEAGYTCVGDGTNFRKNLDDYKNNPAYPDCGITTVSLTINVSIGNILIYPWLQTRYGDVTSLGYINGQVLGSASDNNDKKGARRIGSSVMEADYVISSVTNYNSNFCSNNYYVLGRTLAQRLNCKTGGYTSESTDFNSIRNSLQNAWSSNGSGIPPSGSSYGGSCRPYKTYALPSSSTIKTNLSLGCNKDLSIDGEGGIQKVIGDYDLNLSSNSPANTISGRGTIWVTGDLTISSDIIIDPTSGISDPFNMSNMLIFVEGRVSIRGAVNEIDASIISLGGSDSQSNNNTCYQGQGCGKQLIIKGYFATDNFTNFRRTYFSSTDPNNNPAERIRLTGQSIALPPPGVDKRDSQQGTQLQIDAVELPPRLN